MGRKVAVLGLRHGERHVHGFLQAGAEKVYAVDLNKDLYKNVADDRVVTSDDYKAVLPLVDVIVISLPPFLHREALQAALKTKAARIWIEKPLLDIGENPYIFAPDKRVEVIHELRRSETLQNWISQNQECEEMWLTWRRPVPSQYNKEKYPIGVVHDLGSHLIDLSFVMLHQSQLPSIEDADLLTSSSTDAQEVNIRLKFGKTLVHVSAAWVDAEDWPDEEIVVRAQTHSGGTSWVGHKSTHRHLTTHGKLTKEQIQQEKDWYGSALQNQLTYFTPLKTAIMTQDICNNIVKTLQEAQVL